ncbi:MAG: MFS transporter [Burkholderiales bacterium]|nr:MFS transporter [Burkholderiales bacterium]
MPKTNNFRIISLVFFITFIDMLGIGIIIPIYPALITPSSRFSIIPMSWSITDGFIFIGWLSSLFSIGQLIFAPVLGQLADKYGRKPVMIFSVIGTTISFICFGFGLSIKFLSLLIFARFFAGATSGNLSVVYAIIADVSSPNSRAKNFGLVGMAFGLGFILGPFLGGALSSSNFISWANAATPFYFVALLSFINIFLIIFYLPETIQVKIKQRITLMKPLNNIIKAFKLEGLRDISPAVFLYNAGFASFTTFFGIILINEFSFTSVQVGNYFAYMGIMIVLSQGLVVRRLSGKVKDYNVLRFCYIGCGLCLICYTLIPVNHSYLIYFIPPFLATMQGMIMAFTSSIVTRVTPIEIRAEIMGITTSIRALAMTVPGVLSGYLAVIHQEFPILIGGICILVAALIFWLLFKPQRFIDNI